MRLRTVVRVPWPTLVACASSVPLLAQSRRQTPITRERWMKSSTRMNSLNGLRKKITAIALAALSRLRGLLVITNVMLLTPRIAPLMAPPLRMPYLVEVPVSSPRCEDQSCWSALAWPALGLVAGDSLSKTQAVNGVSFRAFKSCKKNETNLTTFFLLFLVSFFYFKNNNLSCFSVFLSSLILLSFKSLIPFIFLQRPMSFLFFKCSFCF